jgi:hypothetical protein
MGGLFAFSTLSRDFCSFSGKERRIAANVVKLPELSRKS